jgi:phosphatidyl-myo-inositol dimannoside synthase
MKILLITWNYPPKVGGIESLMVRLVDRLRVEGEIAVISPGLGEGIFSFLLRSFIAGLWSDAQHIIGGSLVVSPVIAAIGRIKRVRTTIYAHGLDVVYPHRLYQAVVSRAVRRVDTVIANSENTSRLLRERFGVSVVIHRPLLEERFPIDLPFVAGTYVLFVGRNVKRKGLIPFIEKCWPVVRWVSPWAQLVVAGGYPKNLIYPKVRFLGEVVDRALLSNLYYYARAVVMPNIAVDGEVEGYGMVADEAHMHGTPVVAFAVDGIVDTPALLVEPGRQKS